MAGCCGPKRHRRRIDSVGYQQNLHGTGRRVFLSLHSSVGTWLRGLACDWAETVARVPKLPKAVFSWWSDRRASRCRLVLSCYSVPRGRRILPVGSTVLVIAGGTGPSLKSGRRDPWTATVSIRRRCLLWLLPLALAVLIVAGAYSLTPLTLWVKVGLAAAHL